jgi:tRNA dimethylallyltransferase
VPIDRTAGRVDHGPDYLARSSGGVVPCGEPDSGRDHFRDSALVYRAAWTSAPLGPAPPSVPPLHHLIDIIDPRDAYSVIMPCSEALALVAVIRARGSCRQAMRHRCCISRHCRMGLDDQGRQADPELRRALDADRRALQHAGHACAPQAEIDPITAARLPP